jgi:hypothetical protein
VLKFPAVHGFTACSDMKPSQSCYVRSSTNHLATAHWQSAGVTLTPRTPHPSPSGEMDALMKQTKADAPADPPCSIRVC